MIQSINPATGEIVQTFAPYTPTKVETRLQSALNAFLSWRKNPIEQRIALINKLADHLSEHKEEYARLATLEMGRPLKESLEEINKSISICHFYAKNGKRFLRDEHVPTEATQSYVRYDPLGVILGIMPWNYPFTQALRVIIPTVIAGNTFVLKHASNVPQCALAIEEMFKASGFPKGIVTTLLIEGKNIGSIIADPRITAVTVTGGEKTGAAVAKLAGEHLKKTVLELGGSDAFIVLEDADIAATAKDAVKARLTNAGQSCNSPKRIVLHQKIAKEFTKLFIEEVKKLVVGDPLDSRTNVGPLAQENVRALLHKQVQESVKKGARLLHGGKRLDRNGFFYEVTVLDNVRKGMPVFDEEVFGPVIAMTTFRDINHAIEIANNTHLGLGASIWTRDVEKAQPFISGLDVGLVFVNKAIRSDPRLPYGGVKKSGYGRELGKFGIQEFTDIKAVVIQ